MTIDDLIMKKDIYELLLKQEEVMKRNENNTDYIGHTIHLCSNYMHKELMSSFGISDNDISNYKQFKDNEAKHPMLKFEEDIYEGVMDDEHFLYDD